MSVVFSVLAFCNSEIWTSPSLVPRKFTKAPKSTVFTTLPLYITPNSASATISFIFFCAASEDSVSDAAILMVPSSSISTLAPVDSHISLIIFPPGPITSRIFSNFIFIVVIFGAVSAKVSLDEPIAFAISFKI